MANNGFCISDIQATYILDPSSPNEDRSGFRVNCSVTGLPPSEGDAKTDASTGDAILKDESQNQFPWRLRGTPIFADGSKGQAFSLVFDKDVIPGETIKNKRAGFIFEFDDFDPSKPLDRIVFSKKENFGLNEETTVSFQKQTRGLCEQNKQPVSMAVRRDASDTICWDLLKIQIPTPAA